MTLRPYKFLVAPVVQQVDEDGNVTDELQTERPDVVYGLQGLRDYAESFEAALAEKEAQMNGAGTLQ